MYPSEFGETISLGEYFCGYRDGEVSAQCLSPDTLRKNVDKPHSEWQAADLNVLAFPVPTGCSRP